MHYTVCRNDLQFLPGASKLSELCEFLTSIAHVLTTVKSACCFYTKFKYSNNIFNWHKDYITSLLNMQNIYFKI